MTPLFSPCTWCSHPAITAAWQCKAAMAMANDGLIAQLRDKMDKDLAALMG